MTIQRYLQTHFCSAIATGVVAMLLLGVDQVRHLFEIPPWQLLVAAPELLAPLAAVVALAILYLLAARWIVPTDRVESPTDPQIPPGILPRLAFWARTFGRFWLGCYAHCARNLTSDRKWLVPLLVLACTSLTFVELHEPGWPIAGTRPARAAFSWLLGFWAVWWLVYPGPRRASFLGRMLFRSLTALTAFTLVGELLWVSAIRGLGVSFRFYSLWATLHTCFVIVMVGRVADHWNRLSVLPVRLLLLATLILGAGVHSTSTVGVAVPWSSVFKAPAEPESGAVAAAATPWGTSTVDEDEDRWLQHLAERLDHLPHRDKPVVLVAASGGGSRAALFAALVLEQLRRWTTLTAPAEHSQAPALVDDPFARAHLADQVLLISSVSGGTLASSEFVARRLAGEKTGFPSLDAPTTCYEPEVRWRMNRQIQEIVDWGDELQQRAYGDDGPHYVRQAHDRCTDPEQLWFHQSQYIDHVCTDFMAPLLRGVLLPEQERGEAVQGFWRDQFASAACPLNHTNVDSHQLPPQDRRHVPLLIANVTEVDRGSSLFVGFPPLPPFFFAGKFARFHAFPCRDLTNIGPPDQELTELDLTESTRLSANFPWGFSNARLARQGASDASHLIDGAVFDNTGIATIRYVFERLHDWAEAYAQEGDDAGPSARLAAQIMDKLRRRGVILLEIDSGAKQEEPHGVTTMLPGIFEPVAALQNVSYTGADRVAQEHLRRLKKIFAGPGIAETLERLRYDVDEQRLQRIDRDFGSKLEEANLTMFHSLRITCNHEKNVMTAWALAPSDKAKVFVQFLIERPKAAERLAQLIDVQARTAAIIERLGTRPRPPERYATDELVDMYYDLLQFNRAIEFDLRIDHIQQARTFANLRRGMPQSTLVGEAAPAAPSERTSFDTAAAAPAAPESLWKRFQQSPSAQLRGNASDLKRSAP